VDPRCGEGDQRVRVDLVQRLASAWGAERHGAGKTVRALLEQPADVVQDASGDEVSALWTPDEPAATSLDSAATAQVVLTVDVAQMLDRRAHVEDLTREPQLLAFSEPTARAMAPVVQLAARLRAATTSFHQG
jgi:hypothetical protein